MTPPRRVLITGASGYIGSRLVQSAVTAGLEVVAGVRHPERYPRSDARAAAFDLARADEAERLVGGVDAVIHLAAVIPEGAAVRGAAEDVNVEGARALLDAARRHGVRRFVFVSSHSAAADSPTRYGRAKWAIERMLDPRRGEVAVRLGLVCGGPLRGVYGRLARLSRRHRWLPLFGAGAPVYPIEVGAVCDCLLGLVRCEHPPAGTIWVGRPAPVRFAEFLRVLSRERLGRGVGLIPIPSLAARLACRIAEILPFLPFPIERVRGLLALRPVDTTQWPGPDALGVAPRDYRELLASEGMRRRRLAEGSTLVRYVLGAEAPPGVLRRYARAVAAEPDPEPLDLPGVLVTFPRLLRLCEPAGAAGARSALRRRIDLATAIAEMTPQGALRFHAYERSRRAAAIARLAWLAAGEAAALVVRLMAWRAVSRR